MSSDRGITVIPMNTSEETLLRAKCGCYVTPHGIIAVRACPKHAMHLHVFGDAATA